MIQTECKGCGQKLKVPDEMAGKRARCPSCGDPVKVPGAAPAATSPERPRPVTPPPERPRQQTPAPRRPATASPPPSGNPFDFMNPAPPSIPPPVVPPAPVASSAPPAPATLVFNEPAAPLLGQPPPSRKRRPLARPSASYGALIGACLGVALLVLLGPSNEALSEALGRLPRGKLTVDHIRGALVGLIGGLLVGSAIVALVGRSLPSVTSACLLILAGAVCGSVRQAAEAELPPFLLLAAGVAGAIAGAAMGGLLGAVLNLGHD